MAYAIDWTDDGVATCNHFLDAVKAVLNPTVMMKECADTLRGRLAQVRYDRGTTADVKDPALGQI
jgi:hypothetical protein